MWHAGHLGVGLCGMWDIVELDYVACGTLWSRTMWQVGHCGVRLCGKWDTVESDFVAWGHLLEWQVPLLYSQTLLSLAPIFFGGCPELVDGLGATDLSKSGSPWSSLSPLPSDSPPTSSLLHGLLGVADDHVPEHDGTKVSSKSWVIRSPTNA